MNKPVHLKKLTVKKKVALVLALVLVLGCACVGTYAWLKSKTDPIVNVFVGSKLNIYLSDAEDMHQMQPGDTIVFSNNTHPWVKVVANSVPCYVFIEVKELGNVRNYVEYTINDSFTHYSDNYWYAEVETSPEDKVLDILADNKVTVKTELTTDDLKGLVNAGAGELGFEFDACAVQKDARTLDQAFTIAKAELDQS